jgi:hypothetical protein
MRAKLPTTGNRSWPMSGAPDGEFVATLLAFKSTS